MSARVAVVIGNHQGERVLRDCLESLAAQSRAIDEILVVDGGSTDGSRTVAELVGARFLSEPNRGLGHLYNVGSRATDCEYVLLTNNDVAYEPTCVELLAEALDTDEARFSADPTQLDWDGSRVIHARSLVRAGRLLREYIPGLHLDDNVAADTVVATVSAHGAAMLVRRQLLLELGGFDETFFMEWEDLDLCWRAWSRGWQSVYVPKARLRHRLGAVTTESVRSRRLTSSHHNMVRFALKCLPPAAATRVVAGTLLRLPRHPDTIAPAIGRALYELPAIVAARRTVPAKTALFQHLTALD
jgi:GT2 family glycosyltransferase